MVDGDDAAAAGATEQVRADTTAGPGRRRVMRGLLSCAAALALAPVVAASRPVPPAAGGDSFDETYRGRRIQGVRLPEAGRSTSDDAWRITIDGRPLHLMRRADGTWLSMVDHYTSYAHPWRRRGPRWTNSAPASGSATSPRTRWTACCPTASRT